MKVNRALLDFHDNAHRIVNAIPLFFEPFHQCRTVAEISILLTAWCSDMTQLATELAG
jgi:hypothetical protein